MQYLKRWHYLFRNCFDLNSLIHCLMRNGFDHHLCSATLEEKSFGVFIIKIKELQELHNLSIWRYLATVDWLPCIVECKNICWSHHRLWLSAKVNKPTSDVSLSVCMFMPFQSERLSLKSYFSMKWNLESS